MPLRDAAAARGVLDRVQLLHRPDDHPGSVPAVIQDALIGRRVQRLTYLNREGTRTHREVEPVRFATVRGRYWYLLGRCRLRLAARAFRIDRIVHAETTGEPAPAHPYEDFTSAPAISSTTPPPSTDRPGSRARRAAGHH